MKIQTKKGTQVEINNNLYKLVKESKKARERKFNARTVAYVLKQEHPALQDITLDSLEMYVKKAKSLSRQWRKLLEETPELRGNDYHRKGEAVENSQKAMGYGV